MKTTCTKHYADLPFAHRQHNHDGHCALIHGHNWAFTFTFEADQLDSNGFVIDFGKLKWLRRWLEDHFDHTLVLNSSDSQLEYLQTVLMPVGGGEPIFAKIVLVPNCGAEGLARWVHGAVTALLTVHASEAVIERGLRVQSVEVHEDARNHATYTA